MLEGCTAWPEELAERYRRAGYWIGARLGDGLRRAAEHDASRIAIVAGAERWSYGRVAARVERLAAGLATLGLRAGDRVVVQLPNAPDFLLAVHALLRLGAVPVLALPAHRRAEVVHLCERSAARAYLVAERIGSFDARELAAEALRACPSLDHVIVAGARGPSGDFVALDELDVAPRSLPDVDPSEVALFLLSGGTTGLPKLIPRTHDDYAYQLRATAAALRFGPASAYLAVIPVAHNAALGCPGVLGALECGGTAVLAATPSPDEAFPLIERERVALTTLMPAIVSLWLDLVTPGEVDFSHMVLQVGGAHLRPELAARVPKVLGCRLTHWFGMAEGLLSYTRLDDPDDVVCHTQGRPLSPDDEVRIVDDDERDLPSGQVGHLLVRGPYTLRGYYRAEEDNRRAFTSDGFLRTGDLARRTAEGNLIVEGRTKDVINRGGEKIAAEEVEALLLRHAAVHGAALVAVPDDVLGEKSCAFVVARGVDPTLAEIKDFLRREGLAEFKLPDRLEIIGDLPHTAIGKIDKATLVRVAEQRRAQRRTERAS